MLKDPFYAPCDDTPRPPSPDHTPLRPVRPRVLSPARKPTAGIFLPGGAKKAWDAGTKWPGKGRLTSPAAMKAAAANSLKSTAEGPTTNAVCIDKSTGMAFYRHADGRLSPRAL